VANDLRAAMRGKAGAARRAAAIVAGFALTAFAYATTRLGAAAEALSRRLLSRVRVWGA
jgi:glucosyl-dolichyl phosphate glucuronosyltransferase